MPLSLSLVITMSANGSAAAPTRDTRNVPRDGYLKEVRLHVPSGHAGLAPVWVEVGGVPVLPSDQGTFALDNVPDLPLPAQLFLDRDTTLSLAGYNTDTANAHTTRAVALILLPGDEGYPGAK